MADIAAFAAWRRQLGGKWGEKRKRARFSDRAPFLSVSRSAGRADAGLRTHILGVEASPVLAPRALVSSFENSQMPPKAMAIENSAGIV